MTWSTGRTPVTRRGARCASLQAGPIADPRRCSPPRWRSLSPYFLTGRNLTNLGFQASFVAVLALGQLLVIITRGIDLSVGSVGRRWPASLAVGAGARRGDARACSR